MDTSESIELYTFSGTGNSLLAANWFKTVANDKGYTCNVNLIDKRNPTLETSDAKLIGFLYPAHGFSLPWFALKFILRFPRATNQCSIFLVNCRAGMKLYKLFTPGLSGVAIHLPLLILWLKGYKIAGAQPLDMPSNWISIHPGLRNKVVDSITERCKGIMKSFAQKVLQGKRTFPFIYFASIPLDIAIAPVALGYFIVGRFFLAKTFFASHTCNGCKLCAEKCPVNAITFRHKRPYWTFNCESCMRCMNICPKKSINTGHGYAAAIIIGISAIPFAQQITEGIVHIAPKTYALMPGLISLTVVTLICLPVMWITYYLLQYLCRFKAFSSVIMLTSFTYYWRRYLAPTISAKSFIRKNR